MEKKTKQIVLIIVVLMIIISVLLVWYEFIGPNTIKSCDGHCDAISFMENKANNSINLVSFTSNLRYDGLCFISNLSKNKYYVQNNMSIGLNQINRKTGQLKFSDTITGFETGIKYTLIYEPTNEILYYVIFPK